ncbi:MAG: xylulokinase [Actinomycetota bacterium]
MGKKVLLGVDIGTSSIKSTIYTLKGMEVESNLNNYPITKPKPGWVEIDPEMVWKAVIKSIRGLKSLNKNYEFQAAGITAMMIMPVFLNKEREVIRPVIHWFDERLFTQFNKLKQENKDGIISEYSGSAPTGESTINAVYWLKENEPASYNKIYKFFMIKDYIRFKLTGGIYSDYGDASGSQFLDAKNWVWSSQIIEELGINRKIFPDLKKATEIGGKVTREASSLTGIKEGTPVAVGTGDGICTIVGLGVYKDGQVGITVGSAGVIAAASRKFPEDIKKRGYIMCHPAGDRWFSLMATASSGEVFRWFKDSIIKCPSISFEDLEKEAQEIRPGTGNLMFLPYILGSRNPHRNPDATGMLIGLRHKHNRSHITRAIIEGISLELLDIFSAQGEILGNQGIKIGETRLSGGILKSKLWTEVLADIFQKDLVVAKARELGTLGSAIIASVALGIHSDLEEAISDMVEVEKVVEKDESLKNIYQQKFNSFKNAYKIFEKELNFFKK